MRIVITGFLLCCALFGFAVPPSLAWDESTTANLLIFDSSGEVTATYHLDDWTTLVSGGQVTHQLWQAGEPPVLTVTQATAFSLGSGQTAVPNNLEGTSPPPPAGMPRVSMYTFDQSFFADIAPNEPGLSASQPSGTYSNTLALQFTCLPWPGAPAGTCRVSVSLPGVPFALLHDSPYTYFVAESVDLQVQAVYTEASTNTTHSTQRTFSYTINHPDSWTGDSDGDGFPDVWEISHGLDPLTAMSDDQRRTDSDNDGMNDIDEILRGSDPHDPTSLPLDTDNDHWSDWDEEIRGTNPGDAVSRPTATRLYEVEAKIMGSFAGDPGSWSQGHLAISTLQGDILRGNIMLGGVLQALDNVPVNDAGSYEVERVPVGREALIRAVQPESQLAQSRYLPMIPDPDPKDVTGTWSTAAQWEELYKQYLRDHLWVTLDSFDISPADRAELGLLARVMEVNGGLAPGTWYGFGSFGHQPPLAALDSLAVRLAHQHRDINALMEGYTTLLDSGCNHIRDEILAIADHQPDAFEEDGALYFQQDEGTYTALLGLRYTFSELQKTGLPLCEVLDDNNDLDQDQLTGIQELLAGAPDPFVSDTDNDGFSDSEDNCPGTANISQLDTDGDGQGNACDDDDDNDGLSDGEEMAFGSSPLNPDTDNDGINDAEEWAAGTDPGIAVYAVDYVSPTNQAGQVVTGYRGTGATVSLSLAGGSIGPVEYPDDNTWSCQISDLTDEGPHLLTMSAVNGGSHGYGSAEIVLDLTAPQVDITSPASGSTVDRFDPLLIYTVDSGFSTAVTLDTTAIATRSGQRLPAMAEGAHVVEVVVTDRAGNTGLDSSSFVVDVLYPGRHLVAVPEKIDFGPVNPGSNADQGATLTNLGQQSVTIGTVGSGDGLAAPFAIVSDQCSGKVLAFEQSCQITVRVSPTDKSRIDDTFAVPSDDVDRNPLIIEVSVGHNFPWTMFLPAIVSH